MDEISVDDVLLALHRTLASAGFANEALDLSIDVLGPAPQSRSRKRRLELLARTPVLYAEVFGVEALISSVHRIPV